MGLNHWLLFLHNSWSLEYLKTTLLLWKHILQEIIDMTHCNTCKDMCNQSDNLPVIKQGTKTKIYISKIKFNWWNSENHQHQIYFWNVSASVGRKKPMRCTTIKLKMQPHLFAVLTEVCSHVLNFIVIGQYTTDLTESKIKVFTVFRLVHFFYIFHIIYLFTTKYK